MSTAQTAKFIGDHLGTIVQFLVTAWFAKVARDFQVTLSVYGTRLDTTREAVRRSRVLWWMKSQAPEWTTTMNEMQDWIAVSEVYLTPTAADAFTDILTWKGLEGSLPSGSDTREFFDKANKAWKTLRLELLRFRKRPVTDLLWDWATKISRKKAVPRVRPLPPA